MIHSVVLLLVDAESSGRPLSVRNSFMAEGFSQPSLFHYTIGGRIFQRKQDRFLRSGESAGSIEGNTSAGAHVAIGIVKYILRFCWGVTAFPGAAVRPEHGHVLGRRPGNTILWLSSGSSGCRIPFRRSIPDCTEHLRPLLRLHE